MTLPWFFGGLTLVWFFILVVVPLFAVIAVLASYGTRRARERAAAEEVAEVGHVQAEEDWLPDDDAWLAAREGDAS